MAQLPADRTKLNAAVANQQPSIVASAKANREALIEAYDTIDLLNQKVDTAISNGKMGNEISSDVDMRGYRIRNLAAPTSNTDAARKAEVDGKVSKSGDTMTGKLISAGSSGSIANSEPDKGMIEVRSASDTDAAFMTFHRMGVYASYIGIDVDNKWKVGGWSAGSSAREIWHAGNVPIETGTWTPIITSTSGSNNHTYGSRSGRYVRMGDLVFVWGNVSLTAKDSGMAGTVVIGGLPFLVANDGHYPAVNIGWYGYVAKGNSNQLTARFDPNSPIVSLWEGGDNLGPVALAASKITDTTEFAIGGVYKTNV